MTHYRVVLVTAGLLILPRFVLAQQPKVPTKAAPTAAEAAAIAQEQRVLQAIVRADVAGMNDALGSPHILMVGDDGMSTWTEESAAAFMKACHTTSETPSDFRSVVAGKDVVVLAYKSEGEQVCQGRPSVPYTNALSVWQRKGGRWSLVAHSETPPSSAATTAHPYQGVYQYLPPLKGLGVYHGAHFNFLLGREDGSGGMVSTAGTYQMVGDTAVATVLFSTSPATEPGSQFRWVVRSAAGDTSAYTLLDAFGRPIGSGRAVKVRE